MCSPGSHRAFVRAARDIGIVVVEEVRHVRVSVLGSVGESGEDRKWQSDDGGELASATVMRRGTGARPTRCPAAGTATREGMGPGPAWSIARARMAPHAASRCDGRGAREPNARIASAASASSMVLASVPPVSAS